MSKVVKSIGKVFKAVGNAVKKIVKSKAFKVIAIAAAVVFTGGMAIGAFGTAATAATVAGGLSSIPLVGEVAAGIFTAGAGVGTAVAGLVSSAMGTGEAVATGSTTLEGAAPMAEMAGPTVASELATTGEAATGAAGQTVAGNLATADAGESMAQLYSQYPPGTAVGGGATGTLDAATTAGSAAPSKAAFSITEWAKANPALATIAGNAVSGMAQAGLKAYGDNQALDQQQAQIDQKREDEIRKGKVPDMSAGFYKKPVAAAGIINSVKGR